VDCFLSMNFFLTMAAAAKVDARKAGWVAKREELAPAEVAAAELAMAAEIRVRSALHTYMATVSTDRPANGTGKPGQAHACGGADLWASSHNTVGFTISGSNFDAENKRALTKGCRGG
jgi:hypothetical protein